MLHKRYLFCSSEKIGATSSDADADSHPMHGFTSLNPSIAKVEQQSS